ncbi:MAG: leucine-rich repeat domain-containing protein [Bacteroidaceae bacterium]|nr:leucine-rich repeat domain-containing protein [Bacteroidaceae bacterium]
MKHIKHWLATMAVLLCSITASARDFYADGFYYNITSSTEVCVTYEGYDAEASDEYRSENIIIPSTVLYNGKTYTVTAIGDEAFGYCENLTSITIPESVTSIGDWAFEYCYNLTSITIPESVTSIGDYAFFNCSRLTSITIPESVASIGDDAFFGCSRLAAVHISSITSWCNISFSSYSSNPLSIAKNLYLNGELVTELIIPDGVGSIKDYAFYNCDCITEVYIPIINYVTSIGEYAFYNCSRLMYANIPWSVTSVGKYAFSNCGNLTSLSVSEGVASIGHYAFQDCVSLASVYIPASVTSIGECAFSGCYGIGEILVEEGNVVYDSRDNCNAIIETSSNSLITGCMFTVIPESVTSIGNYAFYNCRNLASITIPESVTSIGYYAFFGCGLASITIPENVTSIGYGTFKECYRLMSFTIPEGVTSIGGYAFDGCESLVSVYIPESVTSIGDYAFQGCSSLSAVHINNLEAWCKISFDSPVSNPLNYAKNLYLNGELVTELIIPEGVTSIGDAAFWGCTGLASITLPASVTSIGDAAFSYCSSLIAVHISSIEAWCKISFEDYDSNPLYYAHNLYLNGELVTELIIPEGVTSIGDAAFWGCTGLTSITLPESVTSIGDAAFCNCSSLTSITCEAVNPPTAEYGTFNGVNRAIPLYVPRASISAYQSASYWNNFTNIQALPAPENITLPIGQYGSGTYCSEYALDFSEVEGLKAYVAAGYDSETGVVTLLRVMTANAGVGLFVKGEPGDYVVPTLESTSYNALNMLVGTLEETTVNSTDGSYTNYKYTIREGDAEPKFYPFADASTQAAGRAYLQIPTAWLPAAEQKSISIRFDEGEGTTDIEDTEFTIQNSALIYDLMGRRVANPTKGGIYIVNGKKTVF